MSESRGLLLIAAFAAVWGTVTGISAVVLKIASHNELGILAYAVALVVGLFAAVVVFVSLDSRRARAELKPRPIRMSELLLVLASDKALIKDDHARIIALWLFLGRLTPKPREPALNSGDIFAPFKAAIKRIEIDLGEPLFRPCAWRFLKPTIACERFVNLVYSETDLRTVEAYLFRLAVCFNELFEPAPPSSPFSS
jgi:hypothetical protein